MKFVNRLSVYDVLQILPFEFVYDLEEFKSSNPETRIFRFKRSMEGKFMNIVISDFYDGGNLMDYGVREGCFLGYMIQKFGDEYYLDWKKNKKRDSPKSIH